ncbi:MAG: isoprenylcysteine carboxylmethyltransferase family protein [Gammaproteobacteria bacterium]|nr:isoprenylcysteine carboxylmethyltransferase family protein [Gammaproteobacteria bacterium]
MKRWTCLILGILSYLLFIVTIAYGVAFFGNLFVARTIDAAAGVPLEAALPVNAGLLLLFALQHSGMARPAFKRRVAMAIPPKLMRSLYVAMSSVALIAIMVLWQPIGGVVWSIDTPLARQAIMVVYFLGWVLMIWSTFLLDHFEMFGLRQVWCEFRESKCVEPPFATPAAYKFVRHPVYAGWMIVVWASPVMTISHLVLAIGMTAYTLLGIRLEEAELAKRLPYYDQYRRKVPMLLPSLRKRLLGRADT